MTNNTSQLDWLSQLKWDEKGLLPVIAQEKDSKDVLMFAWMNREALELTATSGRAVYFSRSRNRLWFKGEESGHVQWVHEMRIDCDQDVLLLTSMDKDGTKSGFDLPLTQAVTSSVSIPVIASGGVGALEHLADGIEFGGADAVLAASIFHYGEFTVGQAKDHMRSRGIPVR